MPELDIYLPDIKTALVEELGDSITQEISMFLGDPVSGEWKANTSATEVYVHSAGSDGRVVQRARNRLFGVALEYGLPVVVQKRNTRLTVTGVDEALTPAFYEAQQARPPISVGIDQIQYGTLQQTNPPSMQVWVTAFSYIYNGQEKRWPGGLTANFSSSPLDSSSSAIDIPTTANKAIAVLVQVDGATNTLSYVQSGIYPGYAKLKEDWDNLRPTRDDDALICGYIVLNTGVTQLLNQTNIINSPPWQTAGNGTFANLTDTTITSGAAGDIYYNNGSAIVNLGKGSDGQVLTLASGVPSWATPSGGGGTTFSGVRAFGSIPTTFSGTATDTPITLSVTGRHDTDSYWSGSNPTRLTIPADGYYSIMFTMSGNSDPGFDWNIGLQLNGGYPTDSPLGNIQPVIYPVSYTYYTWAVEQLFSTGDYIEWFYNDTGNSGSFPSGFNAEISISFRGTT